MRRIVLIVAVVAMAFAGSVPAAAARPFPDVISLPPGFQPEGIAIGRGTTFYVGSLAAAGVYRGDLRTGEGAVLPLSAGTTYVGLKVDRFGRIWAAGGPSGRGYVLDAGTGARLATLTLAQGTATFVNDVVVTRDAAWFTDSMQPVLYRVDIGPGGEIGDVETVNVSEIPFTPGAFNLNGIAATPNGKTLIVVHSTSGRLFTVDAATGSASPIDLGGATVTNGDGLLLQGKTLYVVRNRLNQIAVVRLAPDLGSGEIVDVLTDPDFAVPTTIARFGNALYAVNARFGTPPTPTTSYTVVRVDR